MLLFVSNFSSTEFCPWKQEIKDKNGNVEGTLTREILWVLVVTRIIENNLCINSLVDDAFRKMALS